MDTECTHDYLSILMRKCRKSFVLCEGNIRIMNRIFLYARDAYDASISKTSLHFRPAAFNHANKRHNYKSTMRRTVNLPAPQSLVTFDDNRLSMCHCYHTLHTLLWDTVTTTEYKSIDLFLSSFSLFFITLSI